MCASVYYQDITNDFIHHYVNLMKEDPKKTEPMYEESENVQLIYGQEVIKGHSNVCAKIQSLGKFDFTQSKKYNGQPYGEKGDVMITLNMVANKIEYVTTFLLHEIDVSTHRFGVYTQILHPI